MARQFLLLIACVWMAGALVVASPQAQVFAEEHDAHAADDHGSSKPSLPLNWKADLAIWSFVTFFVFLFVLQKMAWVPMKTALDQRENQIQGDITSAETLRLKAEGMLKEYETKLSKTQEEVQAILAEARRDAEHTKQEIVATAQREAEANRQRAIADIEQAKNTALTELFDVTSSNVVNLTERVLKRALSGEDQERLVRDAMADLNVRRN